ncbi:MAG: class I SAM-dependent methyltransferase [Acidiferrobacteraceae bacterium]
MPDRQRAILKQALAFAREGRLYPRDDAELDDQFHGSIDRFAEIAAALAGRPRVLDVGAGRGLLAALLVCLGHECHVVDYRDRRPTFPEASRGVPFHACNVEIEPLPYPDAYFDGVTCCQVLEHFSHSHLPAVREMRRVLKPGGLLEIDVPNVACFRNRWRLIRGKNITWDYREHYLHAEPVLERGHSFYPVRHNREFTAAELKLLLREAGFSQVEVSFLRSRRQRHGFARLVSLGSALRDALPGLRKSLIAFAIKD